MRDFRKQMELKTIGKHALKFTLNTSSIWNLYTGSKAVQLNENIIDW